MGLRQKGRSRVWIDDHGWWLTVVEFQPSSFTQGTYLNVGVNWLWWPKDHLSFDHGGRVRWTTTTHPTRVAHTSDQHTTEFVAYEDEDQFASATHGVAVAAAQRVTELRELFTDVRSTAQTLNEHATTDDQGWPSYHAGVASGLAGDSAKARSRLSSVVSGQPVTTWQEELIAQARDLLELLDDHLAYVDRITSTMIQARARLKLEPTIDLDLA
jgi:hypothetical protein